MKKYIFGLLLLTVGCGDRVIVDPAVVTVTQKCAIPPIGQFKSSCIIKDSTNLYVLINEHPDVPDNLFELPGDVMGIDETSEAAAIRGVKEKTGLDVKALCFQFNTSVTNVFNCGTVDGVGVSIAPGEIVEHRPNLDNVNWK